MKTCKCLAMVAVATLVFAMLAAQGVNMRSIRVET
jgi:hypothetical protein